MNGIKMALTHNSFCLLIQIVKLEMIVLICVNSCQLYLFLQYLPCHYLISLKYLILEKEPDDEISLFADI